MAERKRSMQKWGAFACIAVIAACAVLVCTLFLNYQLDLVAARNRIPPGQGMVIYEALLKGGNVTCAVAGGCLAITTGVLLLFDIRCEINARAGELGVLKAMGYTRMRLALPFWSYGGAIGLGCVVGVLLAYLRMPQFYAIQNAQGWLPDISVRLHGGLIALLTLLPTACYCGVAILFAYRTLGRPPLDLLRNRQKQMAPKRAKRQPGASSADEKRSFLRTLQLGLLRQKKALAFFFAFSAFCFSAMTQMSVSMRQLSSEMFSGMILGIGLLLAFLTVCLALSGLVRANRPAAALLHAFGYPARTCARAVFGGYRVLAYIGFAVGSLYQYLLLKGMVTFVYADAMGSLVYRFDWSALLISFLFFAVIYESLLAYSMLRVRAVPLREMMAEE